MSARTLWQGWWSPLSVAITPVTLLMNLGPRSRFRKLGAPVGGFGPSLDPGRSLMRTCAPTASCSPTSPTARTG
ncbi:hypothetical protein [Streptomyces platensis]